MKKLILLALTCATIVLSNCTPAPSPSPAPSTTYSMTATETALVGDWIWDKTENYSAGVLSFTDSINGTSTCSLLNGGSHVVLKATLYLNTATYSIYGFNEFDREYYYSPYLGSIISLGPWYVQNLTGGEYVPTGAFPVHVSPVALGHYIKTLNATTLIFQSWIPGQSLNANAGGSKVFYHK